MMSAMLIAETFKLLTSFYDIVIVAIQQHAELTHTIAGAGSNDDDKMIETTILHFIVA